MNASCHTSNEACHTSMRRVTHQYRHLESAFEKRKKGEKGGGGICTISVTANGARQAEGL